MWVPQICGGESPQLVVVLYKHHYELFSYTVALSVLIRDCVQSGSKWVQSVVKAVELAKKCRELNPQSGVGPWLTKVDPIIGSIGGPKVPWGFAHIVIPCFVAGGGPFGPGNNLRFGFLSAVAKGVVVIQQHHIEVIEVV